MLTLHFADRKPEQSGTPYTVVLTLHLLTENLNNLAPHELITLLLLIYFRRETTLEEISGLLDLEELQVGGYHTVYLKYLVANATLLGYLFCNSYIGTVLRLMRSRFNIQRFSWGLIVVLPAGCWLLAWMHWSCIDEFVIGFQSVEELYPYSPFWS